MSFGSHVFSLVSAPYTYERDNFRATAAKIFGKHFRVWHVFLQRVDQAASGEAYSVLLFRVRARSDAEAFPGVEAGDEEGRRDDGPFGNLSNSPEHLIDNNEEKKTTEKNCWKIEVCKKKEGKKTEFNYYY